MKIKKVLRIVEIRGPQGPFLKRLVVAYRYFAADGLEIDPLGGPVPDPPPRDSAVTWARYLWQEGSRLFWIAASTALPLLILRLL